MHSACLVNVPEIEPFHGYAILLLLPLFLQWRCALSLSISLSLQHKASLSFFEAFLSEALSDEANNRYTLLQQNRLLIRILLNKSGM